MATYVFERTDTCEKVEFQANRRKITRATAAVKLRLSADQIGLAREINKRGRNRNGNKAGWKSRQKGGEYTYR